MAGAQMQIIEGLGVSKGIAIGSAVCVESRVLDVFRFFLAEEEIEAEVERFHEAVRSTHTEIGKTQSKIDERLGSELAGIFEAHALLLTDKAFLDRIIDRIRNEQINAEWAVHRTCEDLSEEFARIESEHLRARGEDLRDVSLYLLRSLQGISHHELSEIKGDVILIADELTPSEALRMGREQVVGFAIETGGQTSHTTIVARALNLPAVAGLGNITDLLTDQDPVIVDGERGKVILHPTPEVLEDYARRKAGLERQERELLATRELASVSRDGVDIQLFANIELPEEIEDAVRFGAGGVGLYRTEFLYIEKSPDLPTEEEHFAIFRRLAEGMAPYPIIIRTFDLGGRKLAREVMDTREENPVLGLRGIRLTLTRPEIFKTQLRALFRAGVLGDIWIMIPLVTTVEEVRRFRAFCGEVLDELEREGVPMRRDLKLGVMIEVPAAALIADRLAQEVDFLSIGTNDLIQYALAVDRSNDHVSDLYQPLHPAVLRMLHFVVEAAEDARVDVSLCGEMAAEPDLAPLLLGSGLRQLSMIPRAIPPVKAKIRDLAVDGCVELAEHCRELATTAEVRDYLEAWLEEKTGQASVSRDR